jgi:phosphoglycolate phosphatase-like HAD superfamily hydrolase
MIRFLIWDVDGTIFDTYPAFTRAFGVAFDELGAAVPLDRVDVLCRKSLTGCITTLAREFELDEDDVLHGFQRHYASIPAQGQPPFSGVAEVCAYVRAIGGDNYIVTHRGGQSLSRLLAVHHMADYFADRLTADDGYPRKPDPASFDAMIERHHLRREEILAIGDRDLDILAGKAAGVRTCLFGGASPEVAPDYAITDFANLHRILIAENGGTGV